MQLRVNPTIVQQAARPINSSIGVLLSIRSITRRVWRTLPAAIVPPNAQRFRRAHEKGRASEASEAGFRSRSLPCHSEGPGPEESPPPETPCHSERSEESPPPAALPRLQVGRSFTAFRMTRGEAFGLVRGAFETMRSPGHGGGVRNDTLSGTRSRGVYVHAHAESPRHLPRPRLVLETSRA